MDKLYSSYFVCVHCIYNNNLLFTKSPGEKAEKNVKVEINPYIKKNLHIKHTYYTF